MSLTAVILHHYQQRLKYLEPILRALNSGTVRPETVIVFSNAGTVFPEPLERHIIQIHSSKNFGCAARHAAALLTEATEIFFQDDDLLVGPTTVENLLVYRKHLPNAVLGIWGKILSPASDERPYTEGLNVSGSLLEADVVIGRMQMVPRELLARACAARIDYSYFREDDLFLSLLNLAGGNQNWVVPLSEHSAPISLEEGGIGLSHSPDHYSRRDKTARNLIAKLSLMKPQHKGD